MLALPGKTWTPKVVMGSVTQSNPLAWGVFNIRGGGGV